MGGWDGWEYEATCMFYNLLIKPFFLMEIRIFFFTALVLSSLLVENDPSTSSSGMYQSPPVPQQTTSLHVNYLTKTGKKKFSKAVS